MFKKLKEKWNSLNKECLKDAMKHSAIWMSIVIGCGVAILAATVLMGLYPILIPIILGLSALCFFFMLVKDHYKETISRY